jgi:CheY-like chemotaxis protein
MKDARILIVDDEDIARENLGHVLSKEGHEIVSVDRGIKALNVLEDSEFDLVLTDLKMKQVDGMEVPRSPLPSRQCGKEPTTTSPNPTKWIRCDW